MIVTVANHKGGVGKTSLAAHLAFRAAERGNKVLAVDFDAQGNLTGTLADRGKALRADGSDKLFSPDAVPVPMPGVDPNISVLPATAALNATDRGQLSQAFTAIAHLKALGKEFSFIVIDTAPALGLRLTAALAASQRLVIPLQPESYAVDGVASLLAEAASISEHMNPGLAPAEFVINAVNARAKQHSQVSARLAQQFKVRTPYLRRAIAVSDALAAKRPVWRNATNSAVGNEWAVLCDELLDEFGVVDWT
jgi:chromosome partitioning protein